MLSISNVHRVARQKRSLLGLVDLECRVFVGCLPDTDVVPLTRSRAQSGVGASRWEQVQKPHEVLGGCDRGPHNGCPARGTAGGTAGGAAAGITGGTTG